LARYVGDGVGWVDPFAGMFSPAELTNDIGPEASRARYHEDALDFVQQYCTGTYRGVLFDPPYTKRQISEHYKAAGRKVRALDTSDNYYNRVKNAICDKIEPGGYAISFGYQTSGFGRRRGFVPVLYLDVNHGSYHYDTLVVVERKLSGG